PDILGIAMSRSSALVCSTESDARNSSADVNAWTSKPHSLSKSGSDSRTDSSSSTIATSEATAITQSSRRAPDPAPQGSVSIELSTAQGMANANVAPGPSFGSAQIRP